MKRSLYIFGIAMFLLQLGAVLYYSTVFYQAGNHAFGLDSFMPYYLVINIVAFLGLLVLLKYFYDKNYHYVLYAAVVVSLASIAHTIVLYMVMTTGELSSAVLITFVIMIAASIPEGFILIFSKAGERYWLKMAGVFALIITFILVILTIWVQLVPTSPIVEQLHLIQQWTGLIANFILVFYILNYLSELKAIESENLSSNGQQFWIAGLSIIGGVALVSVLMFGGKMSGEAYWLIDWIEKRPENIIRLAKPFEARTFVNESGDSLNYRLLKPLDYDASNKYPLVVNLHGGGGIGTDNTMQIESSWTAQLLSEKVNRERYPAFLFVPQCAPGASWGGTDYWPAVDTIVFEAIIALEKEFNIDQKRRYVMGESLGGYGSWHFACTRPDLFAAAVPICGGGYPDQVGNMADMPVWAFHGAKDRSVNVRESRNMIEAIKQAGGNPKYTEFPDEGHIIQDPVKKTPGLLDWVFAQQQE